jgi:GTP-binding protein
MAESDLIFFVVDAKDGLHPIDNDLATLLRKSGIEVLCLVNKMDPGVSSRDQYEFHKLGLPLISTSATHGYGLDQLVEEALPLLPAAEDEPEEDPKTKFRMCLLGKPNVGKSSLANMLAGESRQLVSTVAGTTRDAVDLVIEQDDLRCLLVDTPGVRRKTKVERKLERLSVVAALRSVERAHVALIVLDGSEQFSDQDAKLINIVQDRGRSMVILVNKMDLLKSAQQKNKYFDDLKRRAHFVSYAPILKVSAKTGAGVNKICPTADTVFENRTKRISTGKLNRFLEKTLEAKSPPTIKGKRAKFYFITQAQTRPPTFVASVNDPTRIPHHFRKYLENSLRKEFSFSGTPIRFVYKKHGAQDPHPGRKSRRIKK